MAFFLAVERYVQREVRRVIPVLRVVARNEYSVAVRFSELLRSVVEENGEPHVGSSRHGHFRNHGELLLESREVFFGRVPVGVHVFATVLTVFVFEVVTETEFGSRNRGVEFLPVEFDVVKFGVHAKLEKEYCRVGENNSENEVLQDERGMRVFPAPHVVVPYGYGFGGECHHSEKARPLR